MTDTKKQSFWTRMKAKWNAIKTYAKNNPVKFALITALIVLAVAAIVVGTIFTAGALGAAIAGGAAVATAVTSGAVTGVTVVAGGTVTATMATALTTTITMGMGIAVGGVVAGAVGIGMAGYEHRLEELKVAGGGQFGLHAASYGIDKLEFSTVRDGAEQLKKELKEDWGKTKKFMSRKELSELQERKEYLQGLLKKMENQENKIKATTVTDSGYGNIDEKQAAVDRKYFKAVLRDAKLTLESIDKELRNLDKIISATNGKTGNKNNVQIHNIHLPVNNDHPFDSANHKVQVQFKEAVDDLAKYIAEVGKTNRRAIVDTLKDYGLTADGLKSTSQTIIFENAKRFLKDNAAVVEQMASVKVDNKNLKEILVKIQTEGSHVAHLGDTGMFHKQGVGAPKVKVVVTPQAEGSNNTVSPVQSTQSNDQGNDQAVGQELNK